MDDHDQFKHRIEGKVNSWHDTVNQLQKEHHYSKLEELKNEVKTIEKRQKEFSEFAKLREDPNDTVKLNVGGK